jgi:hypothetical protein
MQTRWMLWNEDHAANTLCLLSMIPRAWLQHGKVIDLKKCQSHFGAFSLRVRSNVSRGRLEAELQLHGPTQVHPKAVAIRLPHPSEQQPHRVQGGQFNARSESVVVRSPKALTHIVLHYAS